MKTIQIFFLLPLFSLLCSEDLRTTTVGIIISDNGAKRYFFNASYDPENSAIVSISYQVYSDVVREDHKLLLEGEYDIPHDPNQFSALKNATQKVINEVAIDAPHGKLPESTMTYSVDIRKGEEWSMIRTSRYIAAIEEQVKIVNLILSDHTSLPVPTQK